MTHARAMRIESPLPHRYFTDADGIGGRIKLRPEDFIVDEIPLYEPCGEGEHLYLRVQKIGVSHGELLSFLRRQFNVTNAEIGYAGMKDKHAVTRQTVSIHLHEDPPSTEIEHDRITVLWADRHRNKIKRGHLRGNRFSVRVREVDPLKAPLVARTLRRLERIGVPGYFGSQRFGYRHNNHRLGAMLLLEDFDGMIAELLGTGGSWFPAHQRERRELFDQGRYDEAQLLWSTADRSEIIAIKKLAAGAPAEAAIRAIGNITLNFFASSLMSAAFNRVLDRRIDEGLADQLIAGDLAWKHDSRAVFPITLAELESGELDDRLARFEISPSGPLWGDGMRSTSGRVAEIEQEALEATGVSRHVMMSSRWRPEGGRRPFRVPIVNTDIESGIDDHGPYIALKFDLPRGAYATIALREIMKNDRHEDEDDDTHEGN